MTEGTTTTSSFGRWTDEGVYFVTRLKDNAVYRVVKNLPVPGASNSTVRKDQLIRFRGPRAKKRCPMSFGW